MNGQNFSRGIESAGSASLKPLPDIGGLLKYLNAPSSKSHAYFGMGSFSILMSSIFSTPPPAEVISIFLSPSACARNVAVSVSESFAVLKSSVFFCAPKTASRVFDVLP